MYLREVIFGQEQEIQKSHGRVSWIALLAMVALLFGVAWHYGIIASLSLTLRDVTAAVWDMISDLAASIGDLLHYIFK